MALHILDTSHKWNHIKRGFLCLLLSFRVMMSKFIYIVAGINTIFISGKILFHNMDILHFVNLIIKNTAFEKRRKANPYQEKKESTGKGP